ncbi:MAG: sensor histidine kinase [Bacteroidetes bacterium]|nr:sensor histidine kinase [Bacteroidota bacterium]
MFGIPRSSPQLSDFTCTRMELTKPTSTLTVVVHVVVWSLLGFIVLFYPPITWDFKVPLGFWLKQLANFIMMVFVFYFSAYYLVPNYLVKGKKILFSFSAVSLIVLYLVIARIIEVPILHVPEQLAAVRGWKSSKSIYSLDVHLFMVVTMVTAISIGFSMIQRWQTAVKMHELAEKQHITSELALLKAQINPHFFFNTLNNIYALTYSDVPLSREAILKLSRMMRYVLYDTVLDRVLLSQEISFMNDYIELMKLRLHSFTKVTIEVPKPDQDYSVAPMLLLPFIENAFKHGTSSLHKTEILIVIKAQNGVLDLHVWNQIQANTDAIPNAGGGIGLVNTQRRLNLVYPERHDLIIHEDTNLRTFTVDLKIQL